MAGFESFLEVLDNDPFEEYPTELRSFVTSDKFLGHPPLSQVQYDAVECMSQIYHKDDLKYFMESQEAEDFFKKYTKNEIILQLGKGCHDPLTPVYHPETGRWVPLKDHDGMVMSDRGVHEATPSFEEGQGMMYEVTFGNGMKEVVYEKHKYLAAKKPRIKDIADYEMVELCDLKPNDRVAWARNYTVNDPINLSDDLLEILAIGLNRFEVDGETLHFKVHYSKSYLAMTLQRKYGGIARYETATIQDIAVSGRIYNVLSAYGMLNDKRLPKELFKCDNETLARWVFQAYKFVGGIGRRSHSRHGFYFRTLPVELGQDFAHALMRIGIVPTYEEKEEIFMYGPNRTRVNIYVDAYPFNDMLANLMGLHLQWSNAHSKEVTKSAIVNDKYFFVPIKSIKQIGMGSYWTKTVPDTGCYVGNGPISANSGKDLLSTIAVSYVVYKLLCLKDPAVYYGQQSGNTIDIINIAINAVQARTVFFKNLKNKIAKCPWFNGKYSDTQDSISFIKSVTAYSGHSERESHEGLNLIMAILDEISGFGEGNPLNDATKSSENIYTAFWQAVMSRYPEEGKVALLSFPRHKDDFITRHYNDAVLEKEVIEREYTYIINPDLPETDENKLTIKWDEDHITSYKYPGVWAIRRPSWDVNPTKNIENYKVSFIKRYYDTLQRFACMPTDIASDTFFRNIAKIEKAMTVRNPVSPNRVIDESWKPDPNVKYYVHADLAQQQDKCAVAVAHVDRWTKIDTGHGRTETVPHVVVDMLAWWEPQKEGPVDLSEVKRWIMALRKRGLDLGLITFDRWGCLSADTLVYTDNGPAEIRELQPGDSVQTSTGWSKISAVRDTGPQEVFRIKTKLGYEIEATANHRTLTQDGWKETKDIKSGDKVLIKAPEVCGTSSVSDEQAYAIGALIADGWINDPKDRHLAFTTKDKCFADRLIHSLQVGFGYKNKPVVNVKNDIYSYHFWSKDTVAQMRELGVGRWKSDTKRVPKSVIKDESTYRAFLSGYIDGDGGVQSYTDKSGLVRYRLTTDSVSKRLSQEISYMMQALGINTSVTHLKRQDSHRDCYRVTAEGVEAVALIEMLDMSIERKSLVENYGETRKNRWKFTDGSKWLPVVSVNSAGIRDTFDISVVDEEFIANGIVTHNSFDLIRELNDRSFKAETLSVAKKHYEDFAMMLYEERVMIPLSSDLKDEMLALKVVKNKVDHPRKASKDLSDAVTGAIFNAISRTPRNIDQTIEIHTWTPEHTDEQQENVPWTPETRQEARDWLASMGVL